MRKSAKKIISIVLLAIFVSAQVYSWSPAARVGASPPDSRKEVSLPVIMYHGFTTMPQAINTYMISPEALKADLEFLSAQGYTTVSVAQLIDYVYKGKCLPEKPVLLTFDDGYCNNYLYAYPLLREYHCKGVMALIGKATLEDDASEYRSEAWCNCSFSQLREMAKDGTFEIANHTYDLHSNARGRHGASRNPGENLHSYYALLKNDLAKNSRLIKTHVGTTPNTFVWPFGAKTPEANQFLVKLGIKATFSCREGLNTLEQGLPLCLFDLKRCLRGPNSSVESILKDF